MTLKCNISNALQVADPTQTGRERGSLHFICTTTAVLSTNASYYQREPGSCKPDPTLSVRQNAYVTTLQPNDTST